MRACYARPVGMNTLNRILTLGVERMQGPSSPRTVPPAPLLLRKLWVAIAHYGANRQRVVLALMRLLAAKVGLLCIPFLLKALVDGLDTNADQLALRVVLLLVVAYGAARFSNTLFGELRDTLFGRVTEKAMHASACKPFAMCTAST